MHVVGRLISPLRNRPRLGMRGLMSVGWKVAVIAAVVTWTTLLVIVLAKHRGSLPALFDYKGDLENAARSILRGADPYHPHFLAALAVLAQRGMISANASAFAVPVYPPPILLAATPFALLPYPVAGCLFVAVSIVAIVVALRLLEVRDLRCYAVAFCSWPVLFGLWLGTLSPLMLLGFAVIWRWRDRLWPPAIGLAAIVTAKLFPLPIGVWLLMTRRYRALLASLSIIVIITLGAWAAIGFAGIADYPRMLSDLSTVEEQFGSSLVARLLALGFSAELARAVAIMCGAILLTAAWRTIRRPDGERRAFGLAVMAALTVSPLVWAHYLILLFVPIALASPAFSPLWLLPMLSDVVPAPDMHAHLVQIIPYFVMDAVMLGVLLGRRPLGTSVNVDRGFARPTGRRSSPANTLTGVALPTADLVTSPE